MYQTLISAGDMLFQLISLLILINVIFSWIRPNRSNPIVNLIYSLTEPILEPFKRFTIGGAVDFSPFIVILLIDFLIQPLYVYLLKMIFL